MLIICLLFLKSKQIQFRELKKKKSLQHKMKRFKNSFLFVWWKNCLSLHSNLYYNNKFDLKQLHKIRWSVFQTGIIWRNKENKFRMFISKWKNVFNLKTEKINKLFQLNKIFLKFYGLHFINFLLTYSKIVHYSLVYSFISYQKKYFFYKFWELLAPIELGKTGIIVPSTFCICIVVGPHSTPIV